MTAPGTLYGLGVGPGDPELITLKALRLLRACPVLAWPAPEEGPSLARSIVEEHLPGGQTEIAIRMPMSVARFPAQEVYDRAADEMAGHLSAGRDVAVLCEGDPFFYGSFMYLFGRMVDRFPGARGAGGVVDDGLLGGARLRRLAARNDVLTVLPAPIEEKPAWRAALATADAAAILKLGRHFAKGARRARPVGARRTGTLCGAGDHGRAATDSARSRRSIRRRCPISR